MKKILWCENMLTVNDVANYFISLRDYNDITNLKIQKMVYYAYGLHLALYSERLFGEQIEAWEHGPVVPKLYQAFKKHKDRVLPLPRNFSLSDSSKTKFLDEVYIKYGAMSANTLCELTHMKSTPWDTVYHDKSSNCIINDQLLRVYFCELIEILKSQPNIDQFTAAKILSEDESLTETMYVNCHPQDAKELTEALSRSEKGEVIKFDWRHVN